MEREAGERGQRWAVSTHRKVDWMFLVHYFLSLCVKKKEQRKEVGDGLPVSSTGASEKSYALLILVNILQTRDGGREGNKKNTSSKQMCSFSLHQC